MKLSWSQKREARQKYWEPKAEKEEADVSTPHFTPHALDIGSKMQTLQETNTSLNSARQAADENSCSSGIGFFKKDGLLYRLWTPPDRNKEDMAVEQLVVPTQCSLNWPMISPSQVTWESRRQQEESSNASFYWPTLYHDMAKYCQTCGTCQKTSH